MRPPLFLLPLLAFLALLAGCASAPTPPAPPAAVAEADRLARQASQLQAAGQWSAGASWWERAARQFQLLNQLTHLAVAWHNQATCLTALGEPDQAIPLLTRAADLNHDLGQSEAWWRNQLALLQATIELSPTALEPLRVTPTSTPDPSAQPAIVPSSTPDPALLIRALQPRLGELVQPRLRGLWHLEVARWHLRQSQPDPALAELDLAHAALLEAADPDSLAAVTLNRGRALRQTGDLAASAAAWREALSAYESLGHPVGIASALAGLGSCLGADPTASPTEAAALLRRAAENWRALGREREATSALGELDRFLQPQKGSASGSPRLP